MPASRSPTPRVAVIGGGPAGLMAAEVLAAGGVAVDLYDAMPSVGRKFLLAGKGGLNLTHGEPLDAFVERYGSRRRELEPMLHRFGPGALREWAHGLGVSTFVGSSGRVFPTDLKAAPLLRAWLHRLRAAGVVFHMRHRWMGWGAADAQTSTHALRFATAQGERCVQADAVVLALGGGSWARLGSDGAWLPLLAQRGVEVAALRPSNCGFDVVRTGVDGAALPGWSEHFRARHAGDPLKTVALSLRATDGREFARTGEFVITEGGVEGSLVYALSALARDTIAAAGHALVHIDLLPGRSADTVHAEVARPRGSRSLSTHLKSRLGLDGVKAALLHELLPREVIAAAPRLAAAIKALPLTLRAPRPLDEAISSAGGVRFEAMNDALMLTALPVVFCAGEMLDWEAPTGGYLLTACFASGGVAARGVLAHLSSRFA
ncbi:MAG: TIGR03862 family flavoprotein [Burkholderiales bacterium]|nr:TIGR03862 family flavoprotein [Burkholderiales bacterium]